MHSGCNSPSAASSTLSAPTPSFLACRRPTVPADATAAAPPPPLANVPDHHRHHATLSTSTSSLPSASARSTDNSSDDVDGGVPGGAARRAARTSPTRTFIDAGYDEGGGDGGGGVLGGWRPPAGARQHIVSVPSTELGNCSGGGQVMGATTLGNTSTSSASSSDSAAGASLSRAHAGQRDTPLLSHLAPSSEPADAAPMDTSSSSMRGPSPPLSPHGADAAAAVAVAAVPMRLHGLRGGDVSVALPRALTAALSVARGASMPQSASQPATQHTRSSSPSVRSPTPLDLTAPPKMRHPVHRSGTGEDAEVRSDTHELDGLPQHNPQQQQQQQRRLSFSGYSSAPASVPSNAASISPPPPPQHEGNGRAPVAAMTSFAPPTTRTATAINTAAADAHDDTVRRGTPDTGAGLSRSNTPATPPRLAASPPSGLVSPTLRARLPARPPASPHPPTAALVDADGYALPAPVCLHAVATARPRATSVPLPHPHPSAPPTHLPPHQRPTLARRSLHAADDDDDDDAYGGAYGGSSINISAAAPSAAAVTSATEVDRQPAPCVPRVVPTHESVFFPLGTDVVAPVLLHYLTVAGWSTCAGGRDYFSHRRLRGGEVAGHTVRWLHTAKPRNCFVFVVTPVVNRAAQLASESEAAPVSAQTPTRGRPQRGWRRPRQLWQQLRSRLFGEAPWFTYTTKSACARSRIAQVEKDAEEAEESDADDSGDGGGSDDDRAMASTSLGASGSVAGEREVGRGSWHGNRSSSETSCMGDSITIGSGSVGGGEGSAPRRSPHARQPTMTLAEALVGADTRVTPTRCSPHRECTPPYSMSPTLVARATSRSSVASASTSSVRRTPPSARLALARADDTWPPHRGRPTTRTGSPTPHDAPRYDDDSHRHSSLVTPSTGLVPVFPLRSSPTGGRHHAATTPPPFRADRQRSVTPHDLRRVSWGSGGYNGFVWSPVTGTATAATAASGATPGTPRPPAPSPPPQQPTTATASRSPRAPSLSSSSVAATAAAAAAPAAPLAVGVEVIVIAHVDVTAMDYAPRLTSHRLSIEARVARTYFFASLAAALAHFECEEAMELMQEQWAAGMTSQVPRPRVTADGRARRERPDGRRRRCTSTSVPTTTATSAAARRGSRSRSTSLVPAALASSRAPCDDVSATSPVLAAFGASRDGLHGVGDSGADFADMLRAGRAAPTPFATHPHYRPAASLPSQPLSLPAALRGTTSGSNHSDPPLLLPAVSAASASWTVDSPMAAASRSGSRAAHEMSAFGLSNGAAAAAAAPPMASSSSLTSPLYLGRSTPVPPPSAPPEPPLLTSTHTEVVVSVYTADPVFSSILRELLMPEPGTHPYTESVAEQKRLLSMVEVGMPAWAVFYSSTGLPYRRLARLLYSGLTNLWPLLSLAVGLYDLYKHLPQLKRFMEHTFEPLTRWVERRFTLRVSVLGTYLLSVVVTIFSSLSSFVAQFYLVQLLSLPIVQLVLALIKLPFVLAFDTVWTVAAALWGTASLVLQLVRVIVMAPLVLVTNVATLRDTFGAAVPAAVEGTSMSVKWWRTFMEFWETVASPMKNAARAWWDSMMHVSTSAARRETSIRRWSSPKLERLAMFVGEVHDGVAINVQLWWTGLLLPGLEHQALMAVVVVYLYWLFLVISPELWDEVIYASGVRRPPTPSTTPAAGPASLHARVGAAHGEPPVTTTTTACDARSGLDAVFLHERQCDAALYGTAQRPSSSSASSAATPPTTAPPSPATGPHASTAAAEGVHRSPDSPDADAADAAAAGRTVATDTIFSLDLQHDTFAALVAELLLPNAVLGMLQRVRRAAGQGWSGAAASATRLGQRQERRQRRSRHVNASLGRIAGPSQSNRTSVTENATGAELCASTLAAPTMLTVECGAPNSRSGGGGGAVMGDNVTEAAALPSPPRRRRVWRYVNPIEVDVRWAGDQPFAFPEDLLVAWRDATVARWGDAVGRETPRLRATVPVVQEEEVDRENRM